MLKKISSFISGNSLYKNSFFLMASSVATAGFGFVFWIICARLFSTRDVGIATTIISTTTFISEFSLLGLKNGLIRFLPKSETPNNKVNTTFNLVSIVSLILALSSLVFISYFSKEIEYINKNIYLVILLVIFLISFSLNQIQEGIFVAYRSAKFVFIKNVLWGILKLTFTILLISFGSFGIFSAYALGSLASLTYGFYILKKKFDFSQAFVIDKTTIRQIGRFSLGDYIGLFFASVPYFLLPLVIISRLGPESAAFYYIAMQIASVLLIIPSAVNQSLFAEGSHDETDTRVHLISSLKLTFTLLLPLIILILIFGRYILLIFGKHYSDSGLGFLNVMALGGIFIGINQVGHALLHVEKKIKIYISLNLVSATITIILSFLLLKHGLIGIGIAFLAGSGVISLIYLLILWRRLK